MISKLGPYLKPVVSTCFTSQGRISRRSFWAATLSAWLLFWLAFGILDGISGFDLTRIPAALLCWSLFCLCAKRYHDREKSASWLLVLLLPVVGVVWVCAELGFRRGMTGDNRYGPDPLTELGNRAGDYATVV